MTKQNWRGLDAGPDLDRAVAVRLGWTNISPGYKLFPGMTLMSPAEFGLRPDHKHDKDYLAVPAYSTDIGAAMGLLPDDGAVSFELYNDAHGMHDYKEWCAEVDGYYGIAEKPALAIVRAWLAYMDAQEAADDHD